MKTIKGWILTLVSLTVLVGLAPSTQASTATVEESHVGITFIEDDSSGESTDPGKEPSKPSPPKGEETFPQTGEQVRRGISIVGFLILLIAGILMYVRKHIVKK